MQPIRDPDQNVDSPRNVFGNLPAAAQALWFVRLNNSSRFGAADGTGRANIVPGSIVIHSVRGVSLRARTAWREGNRWRHLETSTYLSRPGT
jgi:hypothetical protein